MSDEIVGGVNLEDDGPPLETPAPEPVEQAAAPEQPVAEAKPAEVEAVEVAGQKYVPLAGIVAERKQRQEAERSREELQQRLQQLEQQYGQIAPYAQILKENPQLLAPRQEVAQKPAEPSADPDLVELAQTLDFWDPQTGQPDTKKAARVAGFLERRAQQQAQAAIQPYQQQTLQSRVSENYSRIVNAKLPDGAQVNRAVFDDLFAQAAREPGGMQTLSDPRSVMALAIMAAGAERWVGAAKVQAPPPVVVTETSGGNPRTRPQMSQLEEKIAASKGIAPSKWTESIKTFQKGVSNALED